MHMNCAASRSRSCVVSACQHSSRMDDFEWADGFSPRLGLVDS